MPLLKCLCLNVTVHCSDGKGSIGAASGSRWGPAPSSLRRRVVPERASVLGGAGVGTGSSGTGAPGTESAARAAAVPRPPANAPNSQLEAYIESVLGPPRPLGVGGVSMELDSRMVQTRLVLRWTVHRCLNCSMDVYATTPRRSGYVYVNHNLIEGQDAHALLRLSPDYSPAFHVLLRMPEATPIQQLERDVQASSIDAILDSKIRKQSKAYLDSVKQRINKRKEDFATRMSHEYKDIALAVHQSATVLRYNQVLAHRSQYGGADDDGDSDDEVNPIDVFVEFAPKPFAALDYAKLERHRGGGRRRHDDSDDDDDDSELAAVLARSISTSTDDLSVANAARPRAASATPPRMVSRGTQTAPLQLLVDAGTSASGVSSVDENQPGSSIGDDVFSGAGYSAAAVLGMETPTPGHSARRSGAFTFSAAASSAEGDNMMAPAAKRSAAGTAASAAADATSVGDDDDNDDEDDDDSSDCQAWARFVVPPSKKPANRTATVKPAAPLPQEALAGRGIDGSDGRSTAVQSGVAPTLDGGCHGNEAATDAAPPDTIVVEAVRVEALAATSSSTQPNGSSSESPAAAAAADEAGGEDGADANGGRDNDDPNDDDDYDDDDDDDVVEEVDDNGDAPSRVTRQESTTSLRSHPPRKSGYHRAGWSGRRVARVASKRRGAGSKRAVLSSRAPLLTPAVPAAAAAAEQPPVKPSADPTNAAGSPEAPAQEGNDAGTAAAAAAEAQAVAQAHTPPPARVAVVSGLKVPGVPSPMAPKPRVKGPGGSMFTFDITESALNEAESRPPSRLPSEPTSAAASDAEPDEAPAVRAPPPSLATPSALATSQQPQPQAKPAPAMASMPVRGGGGGGGGGRGIKRFGRHLAVDDAPRMAGSMPMAIPKALADRMERDDAADDDAPPGDANAIHMLTRPETVEEQLGHSMQPSKRTKPPML